MASAARGGTPKPGSRPASAASSARVEPTIRYDGERGGGRDVIRPPSAGPRETVMYDGDSIYGDRGEAHNRLMLMAPQVTENRILNQGH